MIIEKQDSRAALYMGEERRIQARIRDPFPARVRGRDAEGRKFNVETVLSNLSTTGLSMFLPLKVRVGDRLFTVITMSVAPKPPDSALMVAAKGVVLRVLPQAEGLFRVAVSFTCYRVL